MRRYTTLWNIYVIKLGLQSVLRAVAILLKNELIRQAAFWALNDMLIVLPSSLTANVKNIRHISILWNEMMWHISLIGV